MILIQFLITIGILLPDVTFNLIPGETSPYGLLGSILWIVFKKKYHLLNSFLFIFFFLILFGICSVYGGSPIDESIKQVIAYLQIITILLVVSDKDFEINYKFVFYIALAVVIIGLIQVTGVLSSLIDPIMKILIPRGSGYSLINIGRGGAMLNSEPSHATQSSYIVAFLIARHFIHTNMDKGYLLSIAYLLIVLVLAGAGVGFVYMVIFLSIVILNLKISSLMKLLSIFGFSIFVVIYFNFIPSRLVVISNVLFNFENFHIFKDLAFNLSGFRFPSVYSAYIYSFDNPFPLGPGSWYYRILDAYKIAGFDISQLGHFMYTGEVSPTKPYSFFANVVIEFGFLGYIILGFFIYKSYMIYKKIDKIKKPFLGVSIFGLLFLNTLGSPVMVAIWAFCYKDYKLKIYEMRRDKNDTN